MGLCPKPQQGNNSPAPLIENACTCVFVLGSKGGSTAKIRRRCSRLPKEDALTRFPWWEFNDCQFFELVSFALQSSTTG